MESCCKLEKPKCCDIGPGYATPLDAYLNGKREKLLYVACIQPDPAKPDYLATVDVDPNSQTYCRVIHRTFMKNCGDEIHHFGWNTCSSCHGDANKARNRIVLPCLGSDAIYILNVDDEKKPTLEKCIEGAEVRSKLDASALHTTHCLPNGDVAISVMGDAQGNGKGDFVVLNGSDFSIKGAWTKGEIANFGYDFWYQPYWDVLISSEWGAPKSFKKGYSVEDTKDKTLYGQSLNVYGWKSRQLIQTIDLGAEGIAPLEIRFLHDPKSCEGYVGCALNGNVFRFYKGSDGSWAAHKVIDVPTVAVKNWVTPEMASMITDILISMDDKYLFFSNWLHGDVRQYDIIDTKSPKLVGQIQLGGKLASDVHLAVPRPSAYVKKRKLEAAPQMLQLSLDGKRLYVTTSLYSPWDRQIYPELMTTGSTLYLLDVDTERGGLSLNQDFLVDFGNEPEGPVLAHQCRYPGGDCTSDIFVVKD